MRSGKKSFYAYIVCVLMMVYVAFIFYPKWNNEGAESPLGWDAATYYWYLPATFIYKDLKQQKFGDSTISKYKFTPEFSESFTHQSGNRVITYSAGVALVQLPAFTIAHALAAPLGYPADGFSKPYRIAIQLWCFIIGISGLWFFRKLLLLRFTDGVASLLLIMLVAGTNYLNYAAIDITITHSILFTLYTLLLLHTHRFYTTPQTRYAISIGLLTGLIILVRPSEIIAICIPLLWGMENLARNSFKRQFNFLKYHSRHLAVTTLCIVAIGSIQITYWLYVTGNPFVYSYDDKTFSWLSPHIWKYLTSYSSGWLLYNPMALFIFIGLPVFIKHGRNKVPILVFFIINLYIVSAWDIWWYSGIGGRAMVQSYAISLLIAGTLFEWLLTKKSWQYVIAPVFLLFIYINLWVHYHAHRNTGLYDPVYMSGRYYKAVIGRWSVDKEKLKLQDAGSIYTGNLIDTTIVYHQDFETENVAIQSNAIHNSKSLKVPPYTNSAVYTMPFNVTGKEWIRVSCTYLSGKKEWDVWSMFRTRVHLKIGDEEIKGEDYKPQRFLDAGIAQTIYYDIRLPERNFNSIAISFLNENSDTEILIDDIRIIAFNAE